jgi:proline dehydrogenase
MSFFRSAFIALSDAKVLRSFAENSPLAKRVSGRFIAGTTLAEVLSVTEEMNSLGISVTMDALGENVSTEADARRAACLRVDMEGSPYTQATLDIVRRLHARPSLSNSIGVVVQAYLFRTESDVNQLLSEGIRLRLCKGAYREPDDLAFPRKEDVDRNYVLLAKSMLTSGIFHGLATHDEVILDQIKQYVREEGINPKSFEFQMLYGIRRDIQESLVKEGYRVRAYIPFGGDWYPYFMRRLAERPANVLFIAKNILR